MLLEVGNGDRSSLPGNPDLSRMRRKPELMPPVIVDGLSCKPDAFRRVPEEIHDFATVPFALRNLRVGDGVGDLLGGLGHGFLARCSREAPSRPGERPHLFRAESVPTDRSLNSGDSVELGPSAVSGHIQSTFNFIWGRRFEGVALCIYIYICAHIFYEPPPRDAAGFCK